jgi:hypothetical protein
MGSNFLNLVCEDTPHRVTPHNCVIHLIVEAAVITRPLDGELNQAK